MKKEIFGNGGGIWYEDEKYTKIIPNGTYKIYIEGSYNSCQILCDIIKPFKYEYVYDKEYIAIFEDGYICINDKNHYLINNGDAHIYYDTDAIVDVNNDKFIKDFVYKVDGSNKLNIKTEYDSINEFFDSDFQNNIKLDTLVICSIDTKIPLIKLEKVEKENKLNYRFIVDITIDNGDNFSIKSTIETQEQLSQKLAQTIEALKQYPEFSKYVDDLENCL